MSDDVAVAEVDENVEAVDVEQEPVIGSGTGLSLAGTISFSAITSSDPAERAPQVREKLKQATDAEGKLEIVQGELLYEAHSNGYWKDYTFTDESGTTRSYESWDEYVEVELGMKRRSSLKRIEMYKTLCVELDIPTETLAALEWSKVGLVSKHLSEDNWAAVLGAMDGMSFRQVESFNKALRETDDVEEARSRVLNVKALPGPEETGEAGEGGGGGDSDESFKTFSVKLTASQYEQVNAALDSAQNSTGSDSKAANLDMICTEYLANMPPDSDSGEEARIATLSSIIARLESNYGVILSIEEVDDA